MKDLFGNDVEDFREYADRVIETGMKQKSYKIHSWNIHGLQKVGWTLLTIDKVEVPKAVLNVPGTYIMFRGDPEKGGKCLLVSYSEHELSDRVYRFFKEYYNESTDDEGHSAAYKARCNKDNLDCYYYKFIPKHSYPKAQREHKLSQVVKNMAHKLDAEYNEEKVA
jgi:hypothetical protein